MKPTLTTLFLLISVVLNSQINQNFDIGSFLPAGWSQYHSGVNQLKDTTTRAHTLTKSALFDDEYGVDSSWLITKQITNLAPNSELSFWQNENYNSYYVYHGVWISTTNGNPASFIELDSLGAGTEDTWEKKTIDLSLYAGQNIYLAFVYIGSFADEWYLDDIKVNITGQGCSSPTNIIPTNITTNSLDLNWTPNGGEIYWKIEYGLAGFTIGTGTFVYASSPSKIISSLNPNTYYDFYIKAYCSANDSSFYTTTFTEKTSCLGGVNMSSLPFYEGFESSTAPTLPCGWTQANLNNDPVVWVTDTTNPNTGVNSAFISYTNNSSLSHNDWLFSPYYLVTDTSMQYEVKFSYTSKSGSAFPEKMEFYSAKNNNGTQLETLFFRDTAILTGAVYQHLTYLFKFKDTGKHYFGFHMFSDGDQWEFMVDDFSFGKKGTIGINENNLAKEVLIYPNPTRNNITLKSTEKIKEIFVYDVKGDLVKNYLVNKYEIKISLINLQKGLYFVSAKTKSKIFTTRIIKK